MLKLEKEFLNINLCRSNYRRFLNNEHETDLYTRTENGNLKRTAEEKIPISQIAEKHQIHPNEIYNWKKKLFESASDIFGANKSKNNKSGSEEKIKQLEDKLKKREEAISYLVQDNIELKKSIDGES